MKPSGLFFAITCLFSAPSFAVSELDHLSELVRTGNVQQAYAFAQPLLAEFEGDPLFDLNFGTAAIDSGQVAEGVFALERVVMTQPRNWRARLELARGYFLLGEDARARREFNLVLDNADPPPPVAANIQRFLDAIRLRESRYTTTATAYVELGLGYTDNVNSAPTSAEIFTPLLGTLTLAPENTSQDDVVTSLAFGGQVNHPIAPGIALFGLLDVSANHHPDHDEFNTAAFSGQAGVSWRREVDRYRLSLLAQHFMVDGDAYRNMLGLNGEWTRIISPQTELTTFGTYAEFDYPDQPIRDSSQYTVGLTLQHRMTGRYQPLFYGTLFGGQERADERSNTAKALAERDMYGVRIGGQWILASDLVANVSLATQRSDYKGEQILFLASREDSNTSIDVGTTWLIDRNWRVKGNLTYTRNESNIDLYEYERTQGMISVRYEY